MELTGRIGEMLLFLGLCASASNLFGETITDGSIYIPGRNNGGTFTLSGSDFTATGFFLLDDWGPSECLACNELSVAAIQVLDSGSITMASVIYITGPQITLTGPGAYVAPFSLTGSFCGAFSPGVPCTPDVPELTGSGLVTVNVANRLDGSGLFDEVDATYTFFVPEPSSIILVGTAGFIFLLRHRTLSRWGVPGVSSLQT